MYSNQANGVSAGSSIRFGRAGCGGGCSIAKIPVIAVGAGAVIGGCETVAKQALGIVVQREGN
jgi:hypothetical protein